MAKCKLCKTDITNGNEYCENCLEQKDIKTNESYLDSLLNSVANTTTTVNKIYKKDQSRKHTENDNPLTYGDLDQNDKSSEVGSGIHENLMNESLTNEDDLPFIEKTIQQEEDNDSFVEKTIHSEEDKDSFVEKTIQQEEDKDSFVDNNMNLEENYMEEFNLDNIDLDDLEDFSQLSIDEDLKDSFVIGDEELYDSDTFAEDFMNQLQLAPETLEEADPIQGFSALENANEDEMGDKITKEQVQPEENIDKELIDLFPQEIDSTEDEYDPSIGDLLSGMNLFDQDVLPDDMLEHMDAENKTDYYEEPEPQETDVPMEDDFLSLLSQFSEDDPVAADVQAINDMLHGNPSSQFSEKMIPSDVGEVFSESLKAVTFLEDAKFEDPNQLYQEIDKSADKTENKAKKKKVKPDKKVKLKTSAQKENVNEKGFFANIFGNITDDEETLKKAASKETAATKAKDSKKLKSKKKNKKTAIKEIDPGLEDDSVGKRQGSEKQEEDKSKKKVKKVKEKKPKKEVVETIEDYEEVSRINPIGASIVFAFFGILVILVIIGTNIFSYSLSITNAKTHFNRHEYTEAYNQVYGVDIKDEDIEIYDKIMTVMFVNKQLNSYNNYYGMKKYPEALDSLLKGLNRYDKYIELATILGIKSDLDYVRDQILAELELVFGLTEKQAISIINSNSQMDYAVAVYDTIQGNMTY